jgi:hypothetical protein
MLPDAVQLISPVELSVRGRAVCADYGDLCIEPFLGCVRISEAGDAVISYHIHFGDASWAPGSVPYNKHLRKPDWFFPAQWFITFAKGGTDAN